MIQAQLACSILKLTLWKDVGETWKIIAAINPKV